MKKGVIPLLWTLVVINVVLTLVNAVFPNHIPVPILILMPLAFALLHGAQRYQWSGIITFLVRQRPRSASSPCFSRQRYPP